MSNVSIKKAESEQPTGMTRGRQSPFEIMRHMLRWDPFAQMMPDWAEGERALFVPDFDVKETKEGFVFKADMPGVKADDIDVKLSDNRLTISGKREEEKEEKTETLYRRERSYGSFSRSFTLPDGTDSDKVTADLKDGVLTLTVPKKPEAKAKQVSVKAA